VEWKDSKSAFDVDDWKASVAAVRVYEAIAQGKMEEATAQLELANNLTKSRKAALWLRIGKKDKAEEAAREAVKNGKDQVLPLATLTAVLYNVGKQDEAKKNFETLRKLAERADLDAEPLARLAPIAQAFGYPADWRLSRPPVSDLLPRPTLASLGPFRWGPSAAPSFTLKDSEGTRVSLQDYQKQGKSVLILFYLGAGCEACMKQLNAFAPLKEEFEKAGISLVSIGPETPENLKKFLAGMPADKRFTFPMLSDPDSRTFKAYRAYDDFENMTLHGAFLIDQAGFVRWQDIGFQPFQNARFALDEAKRLLHQNYSAARTANHRRVPARITSRQN
jgi:peroxiredoxin